MRPDYDDDGDVVGDVESCEQRNVRRAATKMRRYARHNALALMITPTYAEAPSLDRISDDLRNFWQRFKRITGEPIPPYLAVAEWGEKTNRLHSHMGVGDWWERLGAVEVCGRCARPALRRKRSDIPPAGSFCVHCLLWPHGFVGAPRRLGEPGELSAYLAPYLAKGGGSIPFGRHRYRAALGYQPVPLRLEFGSYQEAVRAAVGEVGAGELPGTVLALQASPGRPMRPSWFLDWNDAR